jgi:hypothetical protein
LSDKIKYNFSILFDGTIWRMIPEETTSSLVLEVRNADLHQTSFYSLHLHEAALTEITPVTDEQWWLGLQDAYQGCVILHGYADEQNPVPQGIYCYAVQSGKLLWQKPHYQYFSLLKNSILTTEAGKKELYKLDLQTGILTATHTEPEDVTLEAQLFANERNKIPRFPLHYPAKHAYFDIISDFVKQKTGLHAIEAADYLEYKDLVILSYYIYGDNKLENRLLISDTNSTIIFEDILALSLNGIGLDTFFVLENQLIFIKNKNELFSYELP